MALIALTRPKPDCEFHVPDGVPFIGVAPAIKPWRICGGSKRWDFLEHQGGHGRGVGRGRRGAEEARQILRQVGAGRGLARERRVAGIDDLAGREERGVAAVRGGDGRVLDRDGRGQRDAVDIEDAERRTGRAEWLVGERVLTQVRSGCPPWGRTDPDRVCRRGVPERTGIRRAAGAAELLADS